MRLVSIRNCLVKIIAFCISLGVSTGSIVAALPLTDETQEPKLKDLSLEQLGNLEVSTKSKAPERVWQTAAAVYVITQDDIRRSGATTIPEALRLAPGVEVARITANKWSIGIRGFGSRLSRAVFSSDRWAQRIHHPVGRHLLGSARHGHGRHRSYRGDSRAGRHGLGTERGKRRHQYHHQESAGYPRSACVRRRRKRRAGISEHAIWRRQRQGLRLSRYGKGFNRGSRIPFERGPQRPMGSRAGWLPHGLGKERTRLLYACRAICTMNAPARV